MVLSHSALNQRNIFRNSEGNIQIYCLTPWHLAEKALTGNFTSPNIFFLTINRDPETSVSVYGHKDDPFAKSKFKLGYSQ